MTTGILSAIAFLLGAAVSWLFMKSKIDSATIQAKSESAATIATLSERTSRMTAENANLREELAEVTGSRNTAEQQLATARAQFETLSQAQKENEAFVSTTKQELSDHFKLVASEVLESKGKLLAANHATQLATLLNPLTTSLAQFQARVETIHADDGKDRGALKQQLTTLLSLNQQLAQEAHDLTNALKTSSKTQGNWGEMVLERILESSGLRKGEDYVAQESFKKEEGGRGRPDVVIYLPDKKHLVVDSKVSLKAYETFINSDSEEVKQKALATHIASVKSHIDALSKREYEDLKEIDTPDFVIMFIPIESAFQIAMAGDPSIWEMGWKRNVILVSPSTLIFVLRTVAQVWKYERQNRNVEEIARRGGLLYDKFVGFIGDVLRIKEKIEQAREACEEAHKKLSEGRGNLIAQAEDLRELGIEPKKQMPLELDSDEQKGLGATSGS